jgi:divinyl protochlorophyllide a 8-vinyl-reductase
VRAAGGRIGPNAVLQLLPVVEERLGAARVGPLLAAAGLGGPPDGTAMIPQGEAVRLHRAVRAAEPVSWPGLLAEAGARTADYILANRIPAPARTVLRLLPAGPAAHLLSGAIARHAWTFAGTGRFRAVDAWTFEIAGNPFVGEETSAHPLCVWHAAVFEGLYCSLVSERCRCREVRCGAQQGAGGVCRFAIRLAGRRR